MSNVVRITHIELSSIAVNVICNKTENSVKLREVNGEVVVDVCTIFNCISTETAYFYSDI